MPAGQGRLRWSGQASASHQTAFLYNRPLTITVHNYTQHNLATYIALAMASTNVVSLWSKQPSCHHHPSPTTTLLCTREISNCILCAKYKVSPLYCPNSTQGEGGRNKRITVTPRLAPLVGVPGLGLCLVSRVWCLDQQSAGCSTAGCVL